MQPTTQTAENMNRTTTNAAKSMSDGAAKLAEPTSDMGARFMRVKDQIVSAVSEEAGAAGKYTQDALDQIPVLVRYVERSIRRHPVAAAGVALGLGAIAFKLSTSKKSLKASH